MIICQNCANELDNDKLDICLTCAEIRLKELTEAAALIKSAFE